MGQTSELAAGGAARTPPSAPFLGPHLDRNAEPTVPLQQSPLAPNVGDARTLAAYLPGTQSPAVGLPLVAARLRRETEAERWLSCVGGVRTGTPGTGIAASRCVRTRDRIQGGIQWVSW